jgi:hypothetical protein
MRMNLREIGWGVVEWIQLAQDRSQWQAAVNTGLVVFVTSEVHSLAMFVL